MTRTGIIAAAFGLAAIALVLLVTPGMSDQRFIILAYALATAILVIYIWSLSNRLAAARDRRTWNRDQGP